MLKWHFVFAAAIPEDLSQISKLETLLLNSNRIAHIPRSLASLKHLKLVNLR